MTAVERITFQPGSEAAPAGFSLLEGWGRPEAGEVWMTGREASLRLPSPPRGPAHLVLGLRAAGAPAQHRLTVRAEDRTLARYRLTGPTTRAIRLPADLADMPNGLRLTFLAEDAPINLRFAAWQPDHPGTAPPPADPDPSDRGVMLQFESLGENCEFGLVQRAYGAEPLGLMRFASTDLRRLLLALDGGFAGLGAPEALRVEVSNDEYMVSDLAYGLHYHAWVLAKDMDAAEVHAREVKRVPFLVRKLTEDLASGHKIFVRSSRGIETEEEAHALVPSLRRWGPNELLFVLRADATHPAGTVERREPGFLVGYVERFAPGENAHDFLAPQWLTICRAAEALVWPRPRRAGATEPSRVSGATAASPPSGSSAAALGTSSAIRRLPRIALSSRLALRVQNGPLIESGGPNQTYASLFPLDTAPLWARLIFTNERAAPYRVDAASLALVRRSALAQLRAESWSRVTFGAGGGDADPLAPPPDATTAIALAPASPDQPTRLLSDWVQLSVPSGIGTQDLGLLVRTHARDRHCYSGCDGMPEAAVGWAHASAWAPDDLTDAVGPVAWNRFDGLFACHGLQYLGAEPGATILGIGDGIVQGIGTTGQVSGFGLRACALVSRPGRPVSWFNEGRASRGSAASAAAGAWAIRTLQPQVVLIQTWTENDPHTDVAADTALARAVALADAARRAGGTPVLVTAAPIGAVDPGAEPARQASVTRVRGLRHADVAVLDLDALWGEAGGGYRSGFSEDGRHPTDAAAATAAAALATLLEELL